MKYKTALNKRITAFLLSLIFIISCMQLSAAADEGRRYEGNVLNDWQVNAYWTYSGSDYSVTLENNNAVTAEMTIDFYAPVSALPHS